MVVALISNIFLARGGTFYSLALLAQGGAYTLAALSLLGMTPRHMRAWQTRRRTSWR